jgi:hypothetical protein
MAVRRGTRILVAATIIAAVSACSGASTKPPASTHSASTPAAAQIIGGDLRPAVPAPPIDTDPRVHPRGPAMAALRRTSDLRHVSGVVRTPSGWEAASWTSAAMAQLVIWQSSDHGAKWTEIGATTYPTNPGLTHCVPAVTGADLAGDPTATFIVHGCFTDDGAANAAAVSDGPHGWGVLERAGRRRLSATTTPRHGWTHGLSLRWGTSVHWDIEFGHGRLTTFDGGSGWFGDAGADLFPRVRLWRWSRGGFSLTADTGFIAAPAAAPDLTALAIPSGHCPSSGTYRASFGVVYNDYRRHEPNSPLTLMIFPAGARYPSEPSCEQIVLSSLPITIRAVHTSAPLTSLRRGTLTNYRWITAPGWMLIRGNGGLGPPTPLFRDSTGRDSPYEVPRSLGVNEIFSQFHAGAIRAPAAQHPNAHPPTGTVTFTAGRVTALAIGG